MTDEHRLQMAAQLIVKSRDPDCSLCMGVGVIGNDNPRRQFLLCVECCGHVRDEIDISGFLKELSLSSAKEMLQSIQADLERDAAVRNYNGMSEDFDDEVRPL